MGCWMGRMHHSLLDNKLASIGIGAMIVFIAMVLIAGIAATVMIQTSSTLESQAMATGSETRAEVATGLEVFSIEGYAATGSDISKLAVMVRPRAGSDDIDLSTVFIEISDESKKSILNYTTTCWSYPDGVDDIFSSLSSVFPDDNFSYNNDSNTDGKKFGALVFYDDDNSVTATNPVMNRGDKVYLCINVTGVFNNISERSDIWGNIIPERGSPGVISFRTPSTYSHNVMELQLDL